jgi:hypothetical protein
MGGRFDLSHFMNSTIPETKDTITIFYFTSNIPENGILWSTAEEL